MAVFKSLTDTAGNAIFVNCDQIAFVAPAGAGSKITFVGPVSEGHPTSVVVTAAPTVVLSGETVS